MQELEVAMAQAVTEEFESQEVFTRLAARGRRGGGDGGGAGGVINSTPKRELQSEAVAEEEEGILSHLLNTKKGVESSSVDDGEIDAIIENYIQVLHEKVCA